MRIDRSLVLVLRADHVGYENEVEVLKHPLRGVGHTYYDKGFADLWAIECLQSHGRIKTAWARVALHLAQKDCRVLSLLPKHVKIWLRLLEDVWASPIIQSFKRDLFSECVRHQEFLHVSMDATVRVVRRI